jgi:hypothetical protein
MASSSKPAFSAAEPNAFHRTDQSNKFATLYAQEWMSAKGQKRTWDRRLLMSALPPKADIV